MKKKKTIDEILDEINFSEIEKKLFHECLTIVKNEQKNDSLDSEEEIKKVISEVNANEI